MAEKITPEEYYRLNAQLIEISKKLFSGQIELCTGYINKPEGVNVFDLPEIDLKNISLIVKDRNGQHHGFIPFCNESNE